MISRCYRHLGRLADADKFGLKALEFSKGIDGPSSEEYAAALRNLGLIEMERKNFDLSESYFNQSMKALTELYGEKATHPRIEEMKQLLYKLKVRKIEEKHKSNT